MPATSLPTAATLTLSTGAVIEHRQLWPGAQEAVVRDRAGGQMTRAEWVEYCRLARALARARARG